MSGDTLHCNVKAVVWCHVAYLVYSVHSHGDIAHGDIGLAILMY